jgi:hypothetical protein
MVSTSFGPLEHLQVHATNITDLVIEGEGGIDGNGSCFWNANHAVGHRGRLNYFV